LLHSKNLLFVELFVLAVVVYLILLLLLFTLV